MHYTKIIPMSKIQNSVQRQEIKCHLSNSKYRELSDSELEVVCGGVAINCLDDLVKSPESTVKNA
jgi:hypothetical protein